LILLSVAGCGDSDPRIEQATYPAIPRTIFGSEERPVTLQVPSHYRAEHSAALILVLHGYGADGFYQTQYLRLGALVESEGALLLAPNGTMDTSGRRFWNATPACCNFNGSSVDDVAYLRGLIRDVRSDYNVDPKRIFVIGHSNGGFMAHRLACDAATDVTAIVSIAGATFADARACTPTVPVSTLNVHGDADTTIRFEGDQIGTNPYPSAAETTRHWQSYNRCAATIVDDPARIDLEGRIPGDETEVQRYTGCAAGSGVELWRIRGGTHIPAFSRHFVPLVWQWLSSHRRA